MSANDWIIVLVFAGFLGTFGLGYYFAWSYSLSDALVAERRKLYEAENLRKSEEYERQRIERWHEDMEREHNHFTSQIRREMHELSNKVTGASDEEAEVGDDH